MDSRRAEFTGFILKFVTAGRFYMIESFYWFLLKIADSRQDLKNLVFILSIDIRQQEDYTGLLFFK